MRYLVTGGAGFIGSHTVEALVYNGHEVKVLDNLSTGEVKNLWPVRDKIDFIEGSVTDQVAVERACDGVDCVIHLAAQTSVPRSIKDPIVTYRVNIEGTMNVLLAARNSNVRRVVFASSCAIYGDEQGLPCHEYMTPKPTSPYGFSKMFGEIYGQVFVYGLDFVALRYFNVFGPRQNQRSRYSGVLSLFCSNIRDGIALTVFGDGEQSRDFVYVEDVVNANLLACDSPSIGGLSFNIGSGKRHSLNEIMGLLDRISGRPSHHIYKSPRSGDIRHSQADIVLAQSKLGFKPLIPLDIGLRRTYQWYLEQKGSR